MTISNPIKIRRIISIQRPWLWVLSGVGLIILVVLLLLASYEYGRFIAGFDQAEATAVIDELYEDIDQLKKKNAEILRQNAMLKLNSKIDGDAGKQLEMTYSEAQSEVHELKKELEFYKSIVSPEKTKRSIAVQSFQVLAQEDGSFKYKLTISQKGRNDKATRGFVNLSVLGQKSGQEVSLPLNEISKEQQKSLKFGFKYFQNFEGTLELPEEFWPEYFKVYAKPRSRLIATIDKKYAWTDLTSGGIQYVGQ